MLPFLYVGHTAQDSAAEAAFREWIAPRPAYIVSLDGSCGRGTQEDREPPEPPRLLSTMASGDDPSHVMMSGDLPWPLDGAISRYITQTHLSAND